MADPTVDGGAVRTADTSPGDPVLVPGAAYQRSARLADLTTPGTVRSGHTVRDDWAHLHASGTPEPEPVPGLQIDGYFPAESRLNPNHGWDHDAQFVLRLPDDWNGKLVVTAAPGIRRQYATDRLISDGALAAGYAYAATDKGNSGLDFHTAAHDPGDVLVDWTRRLHELAVAARLTVERYYGTKPQRTYVTGISNGGYLTRVQLERYPELYDGGVDWEGPLWLAEGPNLFTYLPAVLAHYPRYRDNGDADARDQLIAAGLPVESEFLWEIHHQTYWDLTQRTYRAVFDPDYPGPGLPSAGTPFRGPGEPGSDADYDYGNRPDAVHEAVARVALTGDIGKPLLSFHGTLDAFLPIELHSDRYRQLVVSAGRGSLHRQYRIEGGNHVDGFCDLFPDRLRPLLPVYRTVFQALEDWVERETEPPSSRDVAWRNDVDDADIRTW